jgi:SAM-dependent methyltransferase
LLQSGRKNDDAMTSQNIIRQIFQKLGLMNLARAVKRWFIKLKWIIPNRRQYSGCPTESIPLPSPGLIMDVAGTPDASWFLKSGRLALDSLRDTLRQERYDIRKFSSILDFGCGCGRVIRYLDFFEGTLIGVDINQRLIRWCSRHIPFASFLVTGLSPPLPFLQATFDFVYGLSILTHLPESLQEPWTDEFERILKPGGLVLLTVHGEYYLNDLDAEGQRLFKVGKIVTKTTGDVGSNRFGSYHPRSYIESHFTKKMELLKLIPCGALGNPHQDIFILRKRI